MPQTHRRTLSLRLPSWFFPLTGVVTIAALITVGIRIHGLQVDVHQTTEQTVITERERDSLKQVTVTQQQELAKWRADLQQLSAAVAGYEAEQKALQDLESRVRGLLGGSGGSTDSATESPPGPDAEGSPVAVLQRLESLKAAQPQRVTALESAAENLKEQMAYLRARPSGWPTAGTRTDRFGWRVDPFGRGVMLHTGLDFANNYGSEVSARADGTVIEAGWRSNGYGMTVVIDHGYGFRTVYAHNSGIDVSPGAFVQRGEVIARVGSTGNSTGPHVHYEVQIWGQPVDPTPYLD